MKLLCYDPKKKKTVLVGDIKGNILFRKVNVHHYMRVLDGYGIQEPAFQDAISKKVKFIVEEVEETGDKWISPITRWIETGRVADYGHGKQRFLSLKYMNKYKPKADADKDPNINYGVKQRLADEFFKKFPDLKKKRI